MGKCSQEPACDVHALQTRRWTLKPEAGQQHAKVCVRPMQSQQDRGLLSTGSVEAKRRGCKEVAPLLLQIRCQPTPHQLPSHKRDCRFPLGHGHNAGAWGGVQSLPRRAAAAVPEKHRPGWFSCRTCQQIFSQQKNS